MSDMDRLFEKMRKYFQDHTDNIAAAKRAKEQKIAGIAGLCLELGLSRAELDEFESGTDEQVRFYNETLTRYEVLCDQYQALGLMTAAQRQNLDKTLFARAGGESKTAVIVAFPDFNKPDDWEEYESLKKLCDSLNISMSTVQSIVSRSV